MKNGTLINGATQSKYTTPPTTTQDNGALFSVSVSDVNGSTTSNNAVLTVRPPLIPPSITVQPVDVTVLAGQRAKFTVTASGTAPLHYQWTKNGALLNGANQASYVTARTTPADNGSLFAVTISNSAGNVTSNNATLTVN